MGRLTKKQTCELLHILNGMESAMEFLERQDVAVMGIRELIGEKIPGRWYSELHGDKEVDGPYTKFAGSNRRYCRQRYTPCGSSSKETSFINTR